MEVSNVPTEVELALVRSAIAVAFQRLKEGEVMPMVHKEAALQILAAFALRGIDR